jgi:hypothetical protein
MFNVTEKKEYTPVCSRCKIANDIHNGPCVSCALIYDIESCSLDINDFDATTRVGIARKAYDAKQMKKHYEDIEKSLIEELKVACGHRSFIEDGFIFTKSVRSGGFDYATAVKDSGLDVSSYKKEDVTSWKLSYEGSL